MTGSKSVLLTEMSHVDGTKQSRMAEFRYCSLSSWKAVSKSVENSKIENQTLAAGVADTNRVHLV